MANDREFIVQPLITEGKIITLANIDPATTYAQIGVWQANQQQAGSAGNSYPSYVIPLSELTGPKVFRAHIDNNPNPLDPVPIVMTVLEDSLSQGMGYILGAVAPGQYTLTFTNSVLTLDKTATPSNGNFAGLISTNFSGDILQAPEVFYSIVSTNQIGFFAFNLGSAPTDGYMNKHYLEIIVFK